MAKRQKRRAYNDSPTCTWAINNFPTTLKNRYAALCKAKGRTIVDYTEYLLSKELHNAGVDVPPMRNGNVFI